MAGETVRRFVLSNSAGMQVTLMSYGATVLAVELANGGGDTIQVNRGLASPTDYLQNPAYMGAICGRHAGRIAHGACTLQGEHVQLSRNSDGHHLHGGQAGFDAKHWQAAPMVAPQRGGVVFNYVSQAGEEGYPGRLACEVSYTLDDECRLTIDYQAQALDCPTVVNLTNHTYWNLSDRATILDHELTLGAQAVLEFDANLIPSGQRSPVANSAFDFRVPARIGDRMQGLPREALGYDHCFVDLQSIADTTTVTETTRAVAELRDPLSNRRMQVIPDQPAVVVYTGNFLDGSSEVGGHPQYAAVCLECQQYSDAPNHAHLPSTEVHPGKPYTQTTCYRFFQN